MPFRNYELRITNYECRLWSVVRRPSLWVLLMAALVLSGCQSAPASQPEGAAAPTGATLPNAPAVVEPTATLPGVVSGAEKPELTATRASVEEVVGAAASTAASTATGLPSTAASSGEVSATQMPDPEGAISWLLNEGMLEGVRYSYRYPPEWSSGLNYCAPGADKSEEGHLPAGCVSTDILVGQKARDLGQLSGEPVTIDGKRAVRQVDTEPPNVLVSGIYTLLVYGNDGAPLFGFSAMVGANTDAATREGIMSTLDRVASTLKVWAEK